MIKRNKIILSTILFVGNAILLMVLDKRLNLYTDTPKLDFQWQGYDIQFVEKLFSEYGEAGRQEYYFLTLVDIPFPFFVALFGFVYFGHTWKRWNKPLVWYLLATASLFFLIFDCIENYYLMKMLNDFPVLNASEIRVATITTQIKLASLALIYLFIPITLIIQLLHFFYSEQDDELFLMTNI